MESNFIFPKQQLDIKKHQFSLNSQRNDGLILQINHTLINSHGENKKYKFKQATFNDIGSLLSVADDLGNIFVIDLEIAKYWQLPNFGHTSFLSFSLLQKQELLISIDSYIIICKIETGIVTIVLRGHSFPATDISYSDNGSYCLTSCSSEAIIWDLTNYTQIHRLSLNLDVALKKVMFIPITNQILACFRDDSMHVWKFGSFEYIKKIAPETWKNFCIRTIALTKNGKTMAIGVFSPNLIIFCLDTWVVKKVIEFPQNITGIKQLEFASQVFDGGSNKIIVILTVSLEIYFFDIETSTFITGMHEIFGMTGKIMVSLTGKYLAAIFTNGEVSVYSTEKILSNNTQFDNESASNILPQNESNISNPRIISVQGRKTVKSNQSLSSIKKELQEILDLKMLLPVLKQFGEYPGAYRILIWKSILQLPGNQEAFLSLSMKSCHSSYVNLELKYPLVNKSLSSSLKKVLSSLSNWCPLFGEVDFLPEFAFPFVKLFHSDPLACFEVVATILVNWCQNWFEFFPFPPINMLSILENVLGHHDPGLLEFYLKNNITTSVFVCPLFHTVFSEVLSKPEWLKLWDHILSNEPSFLFMAILAYNVICRNAIKNFKIPEEVEDFFHKQNPIDMKKLISKTYTYLKETPEEIHPRKFFSSFQPLSTGGTYSTFLAYPKLILDSSVKKLQTIRREEEGILEEQMKALKIKKKLEKKLRKNDSIEEQEQIYKELEDKIRKTVEEEEDRILTQKQKLENLKRELHLKELEVLESVKDKALKERLRRKEQELETLLQSISKRSAREKTDIDILEKEIRKYYSLILLKKCKLEMELANSDNDNTVETNLKLQREKLRNDWESLQCKKDAVISNIVEASNRIPWTCYETSDTKIDDLTIKMKDLEYRMDILFDNLNIPQTRDTKPVLLEPCHKIKSNLGNMTSNSKRVNKSNGIEKKKILKKTTKKISPSFRTSCRKKTNMKSKQKVVGNMKKEDRCKSETSKLTGKMNDNNSKSKWISSTQIGQSCTSSASDTLEGHQGWGDVKWENGGKCICGGKIKNCLVMKNFQNAGKDCLFESDSGNEAIKSALRTRKQIIDEAKIRQGLH